MKRTLAGLVLGFLGLGALPAGALTELNRSFKTSDGTLSFQYPSGWDLDTGDGYVSVLSPLVAPQRNGHLVDGESKVEFYISPKTAGQSLSELKKDECGDGPPGVEARVIDCRITTLNGRTWLWVLRFEEPLGGVWARIIATIENGRVYKGVGLAPDGDRYREGLARTKSILLTARVSKAGLARTGASLPAATGIGMALVLLGTALSSGAKRSRRP